MPLYDFECQHCGAQAKDRMFNINNVPQAIRCPNTECPPLSMTRLVGASTFVLRGDGWAKDGYASAKKE